MSTDQDHPTLYEWAGGRPSFDRLTDAFYRKVRDDDLLGPLFAGMDQQHPRYVATWFAEVFGGPAEYTANRGGYPHMLAKHRDLAIVPAQRARWVQLISEAADEAELPDDPEFRSAFMAYVEWGTRLALANSQPGAPVVEKAPVPRWGWGEAPPYLPDNA
jgi:hemoglobin